MSCLTKTEVLREFEGKEISGLFCVFCYEELRLLEEGLLYCPNEMCLNERQYNKDGSEVEE